MPRRRPVPARKSLFSPITEGRLALPGWPVDVADALAGTLSFVPRDSKNATGWYRQVGWSASLSKIKPLEAGLYKELARMPNVRGDHHVVE
jgi:hypothetical protein